ncbi:MAG: outer membrane lipoprotein carrier protein LolA [Candidatus Cryptobacteroides sp.]|nr:outer membrane lipoprotein carrier protein LolA [Candidatus Cryptobacteroides sp.]MEE3465942.1 outer membrane lipoprotein carrier protein LolA [Candidatus Cryptobacteroides sp.]
MKKILTFALLLCGIAAGAQNLEGTFTQAKTLKISGRVIKSEGTITFTAPDQLAMLYTKPEGDYFIIDGPYLRMDMRGVALDVNRENNKSIKVESNAIIYGLAGKYDTIAEELNADCTVSDNKDGGKHVVIKVRKAKPKGYSGMELDYKKNGQLSRMVLEEFGGISTEYLIKAK